MKTKKAFVGVSSQEMPEVMDLNELILDQHVQEIAQTPHESRGEQVVKPILKTTGGCCLRTHSSQYLKPVNIERDALRDVARYFHKKNPNLNWGL